MKTAWTILTLTLMGLLCLGCAGSSQAVAWDSSMQGLFSSDPDSPNIHPRRLWSQKMKSVSSSRWATLTRRPWAP